jgi:hypothetical protein
MSPPNISSAFNSLSVFVLSISIPDLTWATQVVQSPTRQPNSIEAPVRIATSRSVVSRGTLTLMLSFFKKTVTIKEILVMQV